MMSAEFTVPSLSDTRVLSRLISDLSELGDDVEQVTIEFKNTGGVTPAKWKFNLERNEWKKQLVVFHGDEETESQDELAHQVNRFNAALREYRADLFACCHSGNVMELNRILRTTLVNLNQRDDDGRTVLQHVIPFNHVDFLEQLLGSGANPNTSDAHGWKPVMSAIVSGSEECLEVLLKHNAGPNITSSCKLTPLSLAIRENRPKCIALLLRYGVNPDTKDPNGRTPVMLATLLGKEECLKILLDSPVLG